MKKFYLAHPFDTRKWVRKWELKLEKEFGVVLVNPFYDLVRSDIEQIDAGRNERYEKLDPIELVNRDLSAIHSADGLVGIIDGSLSYGTIMEIVYAWSYHLPVYSIITNGHHGHPWLMYHSTRVFRSLMEFEGYLTSLGRY